MEDYRKKMSRALPSVYAAMRDVYRDVLIARHRDMGEEEMEKELARLYRRRVGVDLDLVNPTRYTEKIQWAKLYNRDPRRSLLSDKLRVRDWVSSKIGNEYLIPLLGSWRSTEDIDFSYLPDSFVLKTNNSSGTNIIVSDKTLIDTSKVRRRLNAWLKRDLGWYYFEMQYVGIQPMILAEKYMVDEHEGRDLRDYKFLCFDGEPFFVWVDLDRSGNHRRVVLNMDWEPQPWVMNDYPRYDGLVERPECFEEMIAIARSLSEGFDHVRVDMYVIDDKPYFGEMTFTSASGFGRFHPDEYDQIIGSLWNLSAGKQSEDVVL